MHDCAVNCITVYVSQAEIQNLFTSPIIAIPAAGQGIAIEVISAFGKLTNLRPPQWQIYTDLALIPSSSPQGYQMWNSNILMGDTEGFWRFHQPHDVGDYQLSDNEDILLISPYGNPISGRSDLIVYIFYRKVRL